MTTRIYTNLTSTQLANLTALGIREDRSISWLISNAVTRFIRDVEPYTGDAQHKVMSRTSEENAEAVKERGGMAWRYVNACVQRLIDAK